MFLNFLFAKVPCKMHIHLLFSLTNIFLPFSLSYKTVLTVSLLSESLDRESLDTESRSLSPSIFTRTTPDLSTMSWMFFPFLPMTLAVSGLGTRTCSSANSNIPLAFLIASTCCKRMTHDNIIYFVFSQHIHCTGNTSVIHSEYLLPHRLWMCKCLRRVQLLLHQKLVEPVRCCFRVNL